MKLGTFVVTTLALSVTTSSAFAQDDVPADVAVEEAAAGDAADDGQNDDADDGQAAAEAKPLALPAEEEDRPDIKAPLIEDLAVAAGNPTAAPMLTAILTDDWSGVEDAHVFFRQPGEVDYRKAAFTPGTGGLFIARLPVGTQNTGFEYYVEVYDAAKNGPTRLGSPLEPFQVGPATEGTIDRMEREQRRAELGPVHPAWMMLSLGTGILAGAGASAFAIDILTNINPDLETETDPERIGELERARVGDATVVGILSVASVAGLATGIGLLIYGAMAE